MHETKDNLFEVIVVFDEEKGEVLYMRPNHRQVRMLATFLFHLFKNNKRGFYDKVREFAEVRGYEAVIIYQGKTMTVKILIPPYFF